MSGKVTKRPSQKATAEQAFLAAWQLGPLANHLPDQEHRLCQERAFRFDFAFPTLLIAVEIEGRGRHQTIAGYRRDCEKYNLATQLGWRVFRFPATDIKRRNQWGESDLTNFVEMLCEFITYQKS